MYIIIIIIIVLLAPSFYSIPGAHCMIITPKVMACVYYYATFINLFGAIKVGCFDEFFAVQWVILPPLSLPFLTITSSYVTQDFQ